MRAWAGRLRRLCLRTIVRDISHSRVGVWRVRRRCRAKLLRRYAEGGKHRSDTDTGSGSDARSVRDTAFLGGVRRPLAAGLQSPKGNDPFEVRPPSCRIGCLRNIMRGGVWAAEPPSYGQLRYRSRQRRRFGMQV